MLDTIDMFDADLIASIERAAEEDAEEQKRARAVRIASRVQTRLAKSSAHLAEILPARFALGDSWHIVSHGDVDSLSYLIHAIDGVSHFDYVMISTWCMAKPDLDQITQWLDSGRIDRLELYVGEIFPSQYVGEYQQLLEMAETYDIRVVVARNHSKVMLARLDDYSLVIESSANVNTNPRIEQTTITASPELLDFYRDFFAGIKSIDRSKK